MAVGLDLSRALRVGVGGRDLRRLGRVGATVWTPGLLPLGLYGTGLGQVPMHLRPEDAVLGSGGNVTSLPNRGGGGAYFDAPTVTGAITRAGRLLALKSSFLTLANAADLIGVRAFAVVASAQTTGSHALLGRSAGAAAGDRTGVLWQVGNARIAIDRYDGSAYVAASGYFPVQITAAPALIEIEMLSGSARLWQNGVLKASVTHGFPNFLIDRIGGGRTAATYEGSLGDVVSLITDGTAAYDGAVTAIRQYLTGKHGIALA